jgi:tetratricopeptide (TPR) repeat protein
MSESPRTRRVRISSIEMPATPSLPGGGAPNKSSAIRSASSVKTASLSSPPSSAKRVSYKKNMKADPTESRRQYHMNKLRKITASPVFMNSPGGPSLSPRKLYIPSIRNMKNANTDPSTSILPNFNDSMTISLAAPNHKESNNSNRFTSSIVSPGTRQYLVSSFQDHAEQVNPLDNGDQYLLRALLLENTTIDENQLKNVSLYYEKSIAIRDGDDKIAMRLYNYASFTFWRLRNVEKSLYLYRSALKHSPKDTEISFALAEALHLSQKSEMKRASYLYNKKIRMQEAEDDDDDDEDDDEEEEEEEDGLPLWSLNIPKLKNSIKEMIYLFNESLETYNDDASVVLAAADFFVDIDDIDTASGLYEIATELDLEDTSFSLRRKPLTRVNIVIKASIFQRDVLNDCSSAIEMLEECLLEHTNHIDLMM